MNTAVLSGVEDNELPNKHTRSRGSPVEWAETAPPADALQEFSQALCKLYRQERRSTLRRAVNLLMLSYYNDGTSKCQDTSMLSAVGPWSEKQK